MLLEADVPPEYRSGEAVDDWRRNIEVTSLVSEGRLEEALEAYSKAVTLATDSGDQRLEVFAGNRDRGKEQLGRQPD